MLTPKWSTQPANLVVFFVEGDVDAKVVDLSRTCPASGGTPWYPVVTGSVSGDSDAEL